MLHPILHYAEISQKQRDVYIQKQHIFFFENSMMYIFENSVMNMQMKVLMICDELCGFHRTAYT